MQRVIYHEFSNLYRVKIVNHLYENHGWNPILMTANNIAPAEHWRAQTHPDCILQNSMELRQARFDYSEIGDPVPLDSEIIGALSKFESSFISSLQDTTGFNFSYSERRSFYYDMLRYWNTIINNLKPTLFVSFTWLHTPTCYSLYLLCKHCYSIDVLFIDPVPLLDNGYHMIGNSIEELYGPIASMYNDKKDIAVHRDVSSYMKNITRIGGKKPDHVDETHKMALKPVWPGRLKYFFRLILKTVINGYGFKKTQFSWKKNKKPYYSLNSKMNYFEEFFFVERYRNKNKKLEKVYNKIISKPDLNSDYIYFAAPYQPEATNTTNVGVFSDLLFTLDILSSVTPDDWVIYFKENPITFASLIIAKGSLVRNREFYKKLLEFPNIKLVSADYDTFDLIDNARAVATVSGTASWEAAVRGVPAISFGSAWYMGCKSIFKIATLNDAQQAIKKILNGFKPDQSDLERYAAAIEKVAVKGMIHRNFNENIKKCDAPEYEMERIAKALYNAYQSFYEKRPRGIINNGP